MREKLADLCHKQWVLIIESVFRNSHFNKNGSYTICKKEVCRRFKLLKSCYKNLSEQEKDKDRKEADKFLEIFELGNRQLKAENDKLKCKLNTCAKMGIDTYEENKEIRKENYQLKRENQKLKEKIKKFIYNETEGKNE